LRFLLDHQLSPRRVGEPLRNRGHDVRALAGEGPLSDEDVLALAADDRRVLITRNSRDFVPLAREWAEADRSHAGIVLIWTLQNNEHAKIVRGIERLLAAYPQERQWHDTVLTI
jgi:predicted nuclease of predicted toxin-antitoxin system